MKLKLKMLVMFAVLGVASSAYAAWQFTQPVKEDVAIKVDLEPLPSIGTIEFDAVGDYNLNQVPNPLVFTARYLEGTSGVSVDQMVLTYEVVLNEALSELISFGAVATGVWFNDEPTSITPTWNENKNPTNMSEYNALKDNLASYQMRVILKAETKASLGLLKSPSAIVACPLPEGLYNSPYGIVYDKNLGQLKLCVRGVDADGNSESVDQSVRWSSDHHGIAQVDQNGVITPLADGQVYINVVSTSILPRGLKRSGSEPVSYGFYLKITNFGHGVLNRIPTKIGLVVDEYTEESGHTVELQVSYKCFISIFLIDQYGHQINGAPKTLYTLTNDGITSEYRLSTYLEALDVEDNGVITLWFEGLDLPPVVVYFTIIPYQW